MKNNKSLYIIVSVLVVVIISLSVAFAALSKTLTINFGNVNETVQTWNVGFETKSSLSAVAGGTSDTGRSCGTATVTATTVTVNNTTLSKPGDSCRYDLKILNGGSIAAKVSGITATNPTGTNVSCTGSGAQIVCGNITYTLATNTGGTTLLSTSNTVAAGGNLPVYLLVAFTGANPSGSAVVQQSAKFTIGLTQQ